jgi:DNA repair protein RAD5
VRADGTVQGELQKRMKKNAGSDGNGLLDYDWHRVILDEAHNIKNQTTLACKACCMLKAERRWCVSGTIIQNSLDDVYALLKFLRHEPWCATGFWKAAITTVMRRPGAEHTDESGATHRVESTGLGVAMDRVGRLLLPIMLRRTKDSLSNDG